MFGLFRIEETCTYRPPIWLSTLAYSFSAPMALITPGVLAAAVPWTQADPTTAVAAGMQARASRGRPTSERSRATVAEGRPVFTRVTLY